jgi:RsiW-degrading membrane proteinase PrsW (M82 family)
VSVRGSIRTVRISAGLLCVLGAGILTWEFVRFLVVFRDASVLAAALELPLALIGFVLLRRLRPTRAPALVWSAAALVWGATAAAGCALLANQGLTGLWAKSAGVKFASDWSASLSAPLNEEALKLCGVAMIALAAPLMINGPLDGLIFGALTGLGFQAVENVTYGLNAIVVSGGTSPDRAVLDSALLRVGTTGIGSHWTMTAMAGAGLGYLIQHSRRNRRIRENDQRAYAGQQAHPGQQDYTGDQRYEGRQPGYPALAPSWQGPLAAAACLLTAFGMHLLFDAPVVPVAVKVAANFVLVAALYLLLSSAFRRRAGELLAARAAAGLVSTADAASVLSRRRRRAELRQLRSAPERHRMRERHQQILAEVDAEAG